MINDSNSKWRCELCLIESKAHDRGVCRNLKAGIDNLKSYLESSL